MIFYFFCLKYRIVKKNYSPNIKIKYYTYISKEKYGCSDFFSTNNKKQIL